MLTIYFLETEYQYMGWSDVFLELVNTLKEKFNADIIHQKGGHLFIEKFNYNLPDCELIIHDEQNDTLKAITWSESPTDLFRIFKERNNENDILLISQQSYWFSQEHDTSSYTFTIKPTTFYTFTPQTNHNYFYNLRKFKDFNNLEDKLFFLATTRREDPFRLYEIDLCPMPVQLSGEHLNIDDYLKKAINYKIGLSISSRAEVCYRDIEYMAVGLPMLRLEYMTPFDPPLIPDYHYISVPRGNFGWSSEEDRIGGDDYVEAYKKRFFEVKDNKEFLNFITKNAKKYYDDYCSPQNRIIHLMDRLKLKNE
jgi:hypothetical protein